MKVIEILDAAYSKVQRRSPVKIHGSFEVISMQDIPIQMDDTLCGIAIAVAIHKIVTSSRYVDLNYSNLDNFQNVIAAYIKDHLEMVSVIMRHLS